MEGDIPYMKSSNLVETEVSHRAEMSTLPKAKFTLHALYINRKFEIVSNIKLGAYFDSKY